MREPDDRKPHRPGNPTQSIARRGSTQLPRQAGIPGARAQRAGVRLWTQIRVFAGDRRAAVAVEMAIALPFALLTLLTTLELGYLLFFQSVLDGATLDAARTIRTGQVQASADPLGAFKTTLCQTMSLLTACGGLAVEAWSFGSFSAVVVPPLRVTNGSINPAGFTPGGSGQIVAVRVSHMYSFMVPWVAKYLGPSGAGSLAVISTSVFRNEPFQVAG